jgi:hypothetical protein
MFVSVASDQQLYDCDSKTTVVKTYSDNQDAMLMLCSIMTQHTLINFGSYLDIYLEIEDEFQMRSKFHDERLA